MVVFVTGLNTGFYSDHFLQEYKCNRYYEYNKMLLFEDEEKELRDMAAYSLLRGQSLT